MGRIEDLPEASPIKSEAMTTTWEEALAQTRAAVSSPPLRMVGAWAGSAMEMVRELGRSESRSMQRRTARAGSSRTKLEGRVAALEAELASVKERLARGVTSPVVSLVDAGRIAEARQLVGLLVQASSTPALEQWSKVLAPPGVRSEAEATGAPLTRNAEWLRVNAEAHAGKWVALREGALVDEDTSRVALQRRLEQAGSLTGITFVRV
jgi:hypothetical protein